MLLLLPSAASRLKLAVIGGRIERRLPSRQLLFKFDHDGSRRLVGQPPYERLSLARILGPSGIGPRGKFRGPLEGFLKLVEVILMDLAVRSYMLAFMAHKLRVGACSRRILVSHVDIEF